jgi:hypothetical protein
MARRIIKHKTYVEVREHGEKPLYYGVIPKNRTKGLKSKVDKALMAAFSTPYLLIDSAAHKFGARRGAKMDFRAGWAGEPTVSKRKLSKKAIAKRMEEWKPFGWPEIKKEFRKEVVRPVKRLFRGRKK